MDHQQQQQQQQQQQHDDDTATYKIMESSLTSEENQYAEGESDRESDMGMVIRHPTGQHRGLESQQHGTGPCQQNIQYTR